MQRRDAPKEISTVLASRSYTLQVPRQVAVDLEGLTGRSVVDLLTELCAEVTCGMMVGEFSAMYLVIDKEGLGHDTPTWMFADNASMDINFDIDANGKPLDPRVLYGPVEWQGEEIGFHITPFL